MAAIDDPTVMVNVYASNDIKSSAGEEIVCGAFMGNSGAEGFPDAAKIGDNVVIANQEVNPNELEMQSDYYNKPGADMLHEVTEAYQGAKLSQENKVSSPRSGQPGSVFEQAHEKATKQTDQYVDHQDANGVSIGKPVKGGYSAYFVSDGVKEPKVIHIISH